MADSKASEAARTLLEQRWGDTVIRRAIHDLAERQNRLDESHRAALAFLAKDPKGGDDD